MTTTDEATGRAATGAPEPPATELEAFLLELWEAVLDRGGFGVEDDFFELGGDSLLAMHVAASLSDRFGLDMTAVTPFETPTVRTLATYVERQLHERAGQMSEHDVATSLAECPDAGG